MTNEVKNVPEIRFPEFSGEWEENKLNNYLKTSKIKNTQKKYNKQDVLSVSGDFGIVNQIEFQGRSFAGASVAPYGIVETGDIVYTKSPLKSSPYGIIKVNKGESGIVSTLYAIYKIKKNVDANFVEDYFTNDLRLNKYLKPLVNKGAKNDMKVSDDNALIGDVIFPKYIEEQIKISKFFSKLDRQIELEEQKLEKLEEQKKGYMQKIFSQELRFKDDNGNDYPNWENEKLGDLINEVNERTTSNNQYVLLSSTKNGLLSQEEYFKKQIGSKDSTGYKILRLNQLVLSPQNLWLGNINFNQRFDIGIVSPSYRIYNLSHQFDINFAKDLLKSPQYIYEYAQASEQGASVVRRNLNLELFYSIKISLPSIEEQRKIGVFLNKLDKLIRKQYNKIVVLKQRKNGLLQKMFV